MTDSPLDDLLNDEVDDSRSATEILWHYMSSLGFQPKEARGKDTLEFAKTYSDPSGRVGRAVVVIKKDEVGLEPKEPEYITITIQTVLDATDTEVKSKAPAFCRQDILRILAHFQTVDHRREMENVECFLCGIQTAEYVTIADQTYCLTCATRKGLK